jgi:N-carbamoylputrescine amidase
MTDLLRVAAVQAISRNGDVEGNLRRATKLVERAATNGAKLVVCPEFLATGYAFEPAIWDAAEAVDGPTERWLRAMAQKHAVTIGASYLEVEGEDFFNTFTLVDPDGVCGRVARNPFPGSKAGSSRAPPSRRPSTRSSGASP